MDGFDLIWTVRATLTGGWPVRKVDKRSSEQGP